MAADSSVGAIVPSVKSEAVADATPEGSAPPESSPTPAPEVADELDRDLLCPICMQIIRDAFLTACGHSFCYMCIVTHLHNKSDCPCCGHYLTTSNLFPNFLLNKVGYSSLISIFNFYQTCCLCCGKEIKVNQKVNF